jgi:hypothetical protein
MQFGAKTPMLEVSQYLQTIPQSHINKNSMVLKQKQKKEDQWIRREAQT